MAHQGSVSAPGTRRARAPHLFLTSRGEDKPGARDKILNTKVARWACAGRAGQTFPHAMYRRAVPREVLEWPYTVGGGVNPPQTKVTITGKNETYHWGNPKSRKKLLF